MKGTFIYYEGKRICNYDIDCAKEGKGYTVTRAYRGESFMCLKMLKSSLEKVEGETSATTGKYGIDTPDSGTELGGRQVAAGQKRHSRLINSVLRNVQQMKVSHAIDTENAVYALLSRTTSQSDNEIGKIKADHPTVETNL
ncbi:hypothetical protein SARC_05950 [Sphaeroforma arctica JP610]|uniref:Uncharacterized protein n=1 Tax=Sphaeroforma arctica JP610 TaxID=667725 RepID=A0A0L0G0L2_9EUKA|nr:hypothetical protein SARC_05950 [Sphaeroforma arctica JP610]KNC81748.1 hypothetical protein SARC_05950 [Sphaeroforma arctica JP610]|eukprot:XP_014155650.1 hypothetical protein SARC_05950 [Sphaeroforma arctica JP610]